MSLDGGKGLAQLASQLDREQESKEKPPKIDGTPTKKTQGFVVDSEQSSSSKAPPKSATSPQPSPANQAQGKAGSSAGSQKSPSTPANQQAKQPAQAKGSSQQQPPAQKQPTAQKQTAQQPKGNPPASQGSGKQAQPKPSTSQSPQGSKTAPQQQQQAKASAPAESKQVKNSQEEAKVPQEPPKEATKPPQEVATPQPEVPKTPEAPKQETKEATKPPKEVEKPQEAPAPKQEASEPQEAQKQDPKPKAQTKAEAKQSPSKEPDQADSKDMDERGFAKEKVVLTKAERREIQDRQRAEKAQKLAAEGKLPNPKPAPKEAAQSQQKPEKKAPAKPHTQTLPSIQFDDAKVRQRVEKNQLVPRTESQKQVSFFSHLRQYEQENSLTADLKFPIHPAIIQLGLRMQADSEFLISGSNARCVGLLTALKQVIVDYQTPPDQVLSRHLDSHLKPHINYLLNFRPLSVSMGNAIRYIKKQIASIGPESSEKEAKEFLLDAIDRFIRERITYADEVIVSNGISKINDGDVILTYACSSIIEKILKEAHAQGKRFRVVVADGRPKLEGRTLLRRLVDAGLNCSYILLNAVSFVMKEVSKVFLGAHTLFSNGTVMSRVGTAVIALAATNHHIPVIVCCETYKFSERVQLDSFVYNELGNPDDLVSTSRGEKKSTEKEILGDWRDIPSLTLLNLTYDLTPKEFVNLVITEIGMIPCTSVPVVLREYLP